MNPTVIWSGNGYHVLVPIEPLGSTLEGNEMRGLGYRLYNDNIKYYCRLCKTDNRVVFWLGKGAWLRCCYCLLKIGPKKSAIKGTSYEYFNNKKLNKLVKIGIE